MIQTGIKLILLTLLAISAWIGYNYLKDPMQWPVRRVEITGKLNYLMPDTVEAILAPHLNIGFWAVNTRELQQALLMEPWIEQVRIRRLWPNGLRIDIVEQKPMAYWNAQALVSDKGIIFKPSDMMDLPLPRWYAETHHPRQVRELYLALAQVLQPIGLNITELSFNARGSVEILLDNGLLIKLGTQENVPRLERFLSIYPRTGGNLSTLKYVDLRYTNGFAVAPKTHALQ